MTKSVLSVHLDLPFYLKLPSAAFFVWDPKMNHSLIIPSQRIGEKTFSKEDTEMCRATEKYKPHSVKIQESKTLLDSPGNKRPNVEQYDYTLESLLSDGRGYVTQIINTYPKGGYTELKPYTEIQINIIAEESQIFSKETKERAFFILNHFLDIYKIIVQDPLVHRVDSDLNTYLVEYYKGVIPENFQNSTPQEILQNFDKITFPDSIGPYREIQQRLNSLEDIFPGSSIKEPQLGALAQLSNSDYQIPLHYELMMLAQSALKDRIFHAAVLEAETAFEVYITNTVINLSGALDKNKEDIEKEFKPKGKLHTLTKRILEVDKLIIEYREKKSENKVDEFSKTQFYKNWYKDLYQLRNEAIHEGWRGLDFESTKNAISAGKLAIKYIEDSILDLSNKVQIDPSVAHLKNTAGRINFT